VFQLRQYCVVKAVRSLELKIPPPAVAFVMAVSMWLVFKAALSFAFFLPAHGVVAILFAAAGFIMSISGIVTFRHARTTVNPAKPELSSSLVTWGVYTITRNPMYLGLLLILSGWGIFLSNALSFLFLPVYVVYINRFQIKPEERTLTALFGQDYVAYQRRVRRWI
jgi:protein-S-isoprenylcysteine O-methyltransferase Ste14